MGFPNVKVFNGSLDNQVITDSDPYVPLISGMLRGSAIRGTVLGEGEVVWDSPYARYQYYGKVMVGPPPKQVTDIPLQYTQPNTGAFWFEEAKSVNKAQWINGARKIAGGGNG